MAEGFQPGDKVAFGDRTGVVRTIPFTAYWVDPDDSDTEEIWPAGDLRPVAPEPAYELGQLIRTRSGEFALVAGPFSYGNDCEVWWVGTDNSGKSVTVVDGHGEVVEPPEGEPTFFLDNEGDMWRRNSRGDYQLYRLNGLSREWCGMPKRTREWVEVKHGLLLQCEEDGSPLKPRVGDRVRITGDGVGYGEVGELQSIDPSDSERWYMVMLEDDDAWWVSDVEVISRG